MFCLQAEIPHHTLNYIYAMQYRTPVTLIWIAPAERMRTFLPPSPLQPLKSLPWNMEDPPGYSGLWCNSPSTCSDTVHPVSEGSLTFRSSFGEIKGCQGLLWQSSFWYPPSIGTSQDSSQYLYSPSLLLWAAKTNTILTLFISHQIYWGMLWPLCFGFYSTFTFTSQTLLLI